MSKKTEKEKPSYYDLMKIAIMSLTILILAGIAATVFMVSTALSPTRPMVDSTAGKAVMPAAKVAKVQSQVSRGFKVKTVLQSGAEMEVLHTP